MTISLLLFVIKNVDLALAKNYKPSPILVINVSDTGYEIFHQKFTFLGTDRTLKIFQEVFNAARLF